MIGRLDETKSTIRQFKANPNTFLSQGVKARNLPWMMVYCPKLDRAFASGHYPASYFTDCEGLITEVPPTGMMSQHELIVNFDKGIETWQARYNWQNAENAAAVDALVPEQNASRRIEKAPKLLPEKKKI